MSATGKLRGSDNMMERRQHDGFRQHGGVQTMRSRRWAMALMVGVLVSMTACGQGAEETSKLEPRLQRMLPKDTPAVVVTARGGQPAETRQVTGKTFSMYVPTNFQE